MAYRAVDVRVWNDERFRSFTPLNPSGQALFLYLLTPPEGLCIPGVIPAGAATIAESLGWQPDDVRRCFVELSTAGVAVADWSSRLIWMVNALKYAPAANANVVVNWSKAWDRVPECDLKRAIYRALDEHTRERGPQYHQVFTDRFGSRMVRVGGGVHVRVPLTVPHTVPGTVPDTVPHTVPDTVPRSKEQGSRIKDQVTRELPLRVEPAKVVPLDDLEVVPQRPDQPAEPAAPPKPKRVRNRPPASPEAALLKRMQTFRTTHLTEALGAEPLPDARWANGEAKRKLPDLLTVDDDLLGEALMLYLDSDFARQQHPPCPIRLFVAQWSRWVSMAQKQAAT